MRLVIPFEADDVLAIERAVAAYRVRKLTRDEMVEQVRAIATQYGADAMWAYQAIEEALGDEVEEFWRPTQRRRRSAHAAEEDE